MEKQDKKLLKAICKIIERHQSTWAFSSEFIHHYYKLAKDLSEILAEDVEDVDVNKPRQIWKFPLSELKEDISNRYFADKSFPYIDKENQTVSNVIRYDINKLYPTLFFKSFEHGKFDVNLLGFKEAYMYIYRNRGLIKQLGSANAYKSANVFLNGFYGVLMTKNLSKVKFMVEKNSSFYIKDFFENLPKECKFILISTDEFILPADDYDSNELFQKYLAEYDIAYETAIYLKNKDFMKVEKRYQQSKLGMKLTTKPIF